MHCILTIHPKAPTTHNATTPPKGRTFSAVLLGYGTADSMWFGGHASTRNIRPSWLMLTGTEGALRPFVANLQQGRTADLTYAGARVGSHDIPPRVEALRSAGYVWSWDRVPTLPGMVSAWTVFAYLRDLHQHDPGMLDPARVAFVCLTPRWWADAAAMQLRQDHAACRALRDHARALGLADGMDGDRDLLQVAPLAARFARMIDRRTRRPLINGLPFAVQFYLAALRSGLASLPQTAASADHWNRRTSTAFSHPADPWAWACHHWAQTFRDHSGPAAGLLPSIAVDTTHARLDALLARETLRYLDVTRGATTRRAAA